MKDELCLSFMSGEEHLDNIIDSPHVQKPGLLLTGVLEGLHRGRIQVFGAAEVGYIETLSDEELLVTKALLESVHIPVAIITRGLKAPDLILKVAESKGFPVLHTNLSSSIFIEHLIDFLEDALAPEITKHGVLVDVLGIGILITGKSGIGKSECALALVARGHRLVADDAVLIKRPHPNLLYGSSSELLRYHIEVRGIGILNLKDIFGITAIREKKQMDFVVELVEWNDGANYDRLGFEDNTIDILGVDLPYFEIPVSPGRSLVTIVEVAARNHLLKIMGHNSAKAFKDRHESAMQSGVTQGSISAQVAERIKG